jgi:hypothetical protein
MQKISNSEISDLSLVEKAQELEKLKENKPKPVLTGISKKRRRFCKD